MSVPVLCCALRPNEGRAAREGDASESHGRPRERASVGPNEPESPPSPAGAPFASCRDPKQPAPQSQSLSRSYGSDLPTSLTYIVLSTRGCSPWRPAADSGTAWSEITLPPSDFQGPTPMHRTPREARRFTDATSLSLDKPIPGSPLLTKKRELFPGSTLASPSSVALPHWGPRAQSPLPGSGILTRFPFDRIGVDMRARTALPAHVDIRRRDASSPFRTEFSDLLGPTDPCPTAVHMEPFSTSVYKVLICILATTTKICTEGGSTRAHALRFNATDTPSYSSGPGISHALPRRCGMGRTLQRHPFSGLVDSAGELLHTP